MPNYAVSKPKPISEVRDGKAIQVQCDFVFQDHLNRVRDRQNKQMTGMTLAFCTVTIRTRNLFSFLSSLPNQNGLSSFKKLVP